MRLKWGQTEYKGTLVSVDSYMNLQLSGTEEFVDGKSTGSLGQVLIRCVLRSAILEGVYGLTGYRCNNVLWISGAGEADVKMDTKMED